MTVPDLESVSIYTMAVHKVEEEVWLLKDDDRRANLDPTVRASILRTS